MRQSREVILYALIVYELAVIASHHYHADPISFFS
jgi:hypothetical protein